MTKKRRRPIHLHVMVSEEEQALIPVSYTHLSGKSFAAKRELLNVFLTIPQDRIIIVDPMGEYAPLVRRLGGQVIEIAPDSHHHLNPMDVELNMAAGESLSLIHILTIRYTNEKHPQQIYSCKTYNAFGKNHCTCLLYTSRCV